MGPHTGPVAQDPEAQILYYLRLQYWGHAETTCSDALSRRGSDPALRLWRAYALCKSGYGHSRSEAIRELELLSSGSEASLAALAVLIEAHQACKMVDAEAIREARNKFNHEERNASAPAKRLLAMVWWMDGDCSTALRYAADNHNNAGQNDTLVAWIQLSAGNMGAAEQLLSTVMAQPQAEARDLQGLLAQVKYCELTNDLHKASHLLSSCVVLHPWFVPALAEKAKVAMKQGDWGQAIELAARAIEADPNSIDGLRVLVMSQLVHKGRPSVAAGRISELLQALDRTEPHNAALYVQVARVCGSLCGGHAPILRSCITILERAVSLQPERSEAVVQQARTHLMLLDLGMATATFRRAAAVDQGCVGALQGMVHCLLLDNMLQDAELQMEFLKASQATAEAGNTEPMMLFLEALVALKRGGTPTATLSATLTRAAKKHLAGLPGTQGFDFYDALDLPFCTHIAKELQGLLGAEGSTAHDPTARKSVLHLLKKLVSWVPGAIAVHEQLATTHMVLGELEAAEVAGHECLRLEPGHPEALVLQAKVLLLQGKHRAAEVALENALSSNFDLGRQPSFMITKARVLEGLGQLSSACEQLEGAASLLKPGAPQSAVLRASALTALVRVYCGLHRMPEAARAVQNGASEYRGTAQEAQFTLAEATLALAREDVEGAVAILSRVPASSQEWAAARIQIAEVCLEKRRDRGLFAKYYKEVAEAAPSAENWILLAEAYLRIQEPEAAINTYERVLSEGPPSCAVCAKVASAYLVAHQYEHAIEWFNKAVLLDETRVDLRLRLAELYMKLLSWAPATQVLNDVLVYVGSRDRGPPSAVLVQTHQLLARLHRLTHNEASMITSLTAARDAQTIVLRSAEGSSAAQKKIAADICHEMAAHYKAKKQNDLVGEQLQQAVKHDEGGVASIALLAEHLLEQCHRQPSSTAHQEDCLQQCMALMRLDPGNVRASTIMADVMYQKGDYEGAIYHLHQIFSQQPENYSVLVQLLRLLRNHGQLPEDGPRFLSMAAKASPRAHFAPGYHFCRGLFLRWSYNPREALTEFNLARMDAHWGLQATVNMAELYLCPDNENLWEEPSSDRLAKDTSDAVSASIKLLKEAKAFDQAAGTQGSVRVRVLEAYAMMATRDKAGVERAFKLLGAVLEEDQDNVPALLAMSTGFMMLKQGPKARNNLKRIVKMPFAEPESHEFERAWLMLAEVYMESGKYDQAQDLCKKCLAFNKSCCKGYDTLGQIFEKEASYSDAADQYAHSWKYSGEASPMVGYKLAFQYLKAKRYVEAIDVCHKVLAIVPDYAKMREDILDKARASLRPNEDPK